jgi:hypothetical protein
MSHHMTTEVEYASRRFELQVVHATDNSAEVPLCHHVGCPHDQEAAVNHPIEHTSDEVAELERLSPPNPQGRPFSRLAPAQPTG